MRVGTLARAGDELERRLPPMQPAEQIKTKGKRERRGVGGVCRWGEVTKPTRKPATNGLTSTASPAHPDPPSAVCVLLKVDRGALVLVEVGQHAQHLVLLDVKAERPARHLELVIVDPSVLVRVKEVKGLTDLCCG